MYKVISGRFETGNEEEQMGYKQLFGEDNIQYKFDLYFHWYNLVHELGHCLVEKYGVKLSKVQEEMFVNEFAVGYYRYIGESDRLKKLETFLKGVIDKVPSPVPDGQTFTEYYESIWGSETLMNVMLYGYFQLNSVLEAMKREKNFTDVAGTFGVTIKQTEIKECKEEIVSANAEIFLDTAIKNLNALGFDVPEVTLELVDNPMIQCAQSVTH